MGGARGYDTPGGGYNGDGDAGYSGGAASIGCEATPVVANIVGLVQGVMMDIHIGLGGNGAGGGAGGGGGHGGVGGGGDGGKGDDGNAGSAGYCVIVPIY